MKKYTISTAVLAATGIILSGQAMERDPQDHQEIRVVRSIPVVEQNENSEHTFPSYVNIAKDKNREGSEAACTAQYSDMN